MTKIENNYFISLYLDKRRSKSNGTFPLKVRVFTNDPRKQKLYNTKYEYTEKEFKSIEAAKKPTNPLYAKNIELNAVVSQAYEIADNLPQFSFADFERLLFNNAGSREMNVNYYYEKAIDFYKKNDQIGTASNYHLSLKSLLDFHKKTQLSFSEITVQWLKSYETYMTSQLKRSVTTVGIYLRPLRAIFNNAIEEKTISLDQYPFGKRKYKIPAPRGVKKALTDEQLKILWQAVPPTDEQQKAKDYWFFSFFCNGINPKDIALLKNKDIKNNTITFIRAKTAKTTNTQIPVTVHLNEWSLDILNLYRIKSDEKESYVFPIIDHNAAPNTIHRQVQNFVRAVNQHFIKFAKSLGIDEEISFIWARHSFATFSIRKGISMERVSEAMRHTNLVTTRRYFAGFEDKAIKEHSEKLMQF